MLVFCPRNPTKTWVVFERRKAQRKSLLNGAAIIYNTASECLELFNCMAVTIASPGRQDAALDQRHGVLGVSR